jgi:hypothetical protein
MVYDINNLSYTFEANDELKQELIKFLPTGKNLTTQDLLIAYVKKSSEIIALRKELEELSIKLPPLK